MKPVGIFPVNHKGGVGKTTIIADLACALAGKHRVLTIDTDLQGTLYTAFGGDSKDLLPLYAAEDPDIISEYSGQFSPDSIETFRTRGKIHEQRLERSKPDYTYNIDLPKNLQFCYYPYFLFEEHGKSFWETVENFCAEKKYKDGYDFVLIDLPPFRKEVAAPIIRSVDKFSQLFPLIITEPSEVELKIAHDSYESYRRMAEKGGINLKTIPIWAINKLAVEHEYMSDGISDGYLPRFSLEQHQTIRSFFDKYEDTGKIFEFNQLDIKFTGHQLASNSKIFHGSSAPKGRSFEDWGSFTLDDFSMESKRDDKSIDNNLNYRSYLREMKLLAMEIKNESGIPASKLGSIRGLSEEGKSRLAKIYSF